MAHRVARRAHKGALVTVIIKKIETDGGDVFLCTAPPVWKGTLEAAKSEADQLFATSGHVCGVHCGAWENIAQPEPLSELAQGIVWVCFSAFAREFRAGRTYSNYLKALQSEYYGREHELVDKFEDQPDKAAALTVIEEAIKVEVDPWNRPN
jgi:hypothetical protein